MSTADEPECADPRLRPPPVVLADARRRARRALFGAAAMDSDPAGSTDPSRRSARIGSPLVVGPGSTLGRYAISTKIGHGAMGTVFEAFDQALDRTVAIKLLRAGTTERHAERLRREAQALAKLSHPNVVHVYEVGRAQGQWFIAMERVSGQTLRRWHQRAHGWQACVHVYMQAAQGLSAAHAAGLVHRDFKPDNCLIDEHGRVRVLDFGLVRDATLRSDPPVEAETLAGSGDTPPALLTQTGMILGTAAYMPPEQLDGRRADARSDQFSFCVSLYEALYGERPFEGNSLDQLTRAISRAEVRRPPAGTAVPGALRRILLRGLSAQPGQRWPSMDALSAELGRLVAPERRRGWWLALLAGVAALGMGVGRYAHTERCEGAQAQLEGIWDPERRQQVEAAIVGTEVSYAPDTWQRVRSRLDEYAQAWVDEHTEACEATSVRAEQSPEVMDLRMRCLGELRIAMREVVNVLSTADTMRMDKALTLVGDLPRMQQCADVEALRAEQPLSEEPWITVRVQVLREQLAQVRAQERGGVHDHASPVVEAVVAEAEAIEYGPLLVEALVVRGAWHDRQGRYAEAERDLERAYLLAAEQGYLRLELQALSRLTFLVGIRQKRLEAGLQWGKTALALARGRVIDPLAEAEVLHIIGTILGEQGELDAALAHHRQALAMSEAVGETEDFGFAGILSSIGVVLRRQGELEQSRESQQQALAIVEAVLGPRHPYVAVALGNLGRVSYQQGHVQEAERQLRRALEIQEAALGSEHPEVANTLSSIGNVLRGEGRLLEALEYQQRALAIQEVVLGPRQADLALTVTNMGVTLADLGRTDEALVHFRRALEIFEQSLGPRHATVGSVLDNIGEILRDRGELAEALEHHERALSIKEQTLGPRHPKVAASLDNIGLLLRMQGRLDDARDRYERSRSIREQELGPDHVVVADSLRGLAQVALDQGQAPIARAHAQRVVAIVEASELPPQRLASARLLLARVLWLDPSQRARARILAEQVHEGLGAHTGAPSELRVEVERWLDEHRLR